MTYGTPQYAKSNGTGGHDVFISYSKDQDEAYKLCGILESNGISCWIAPRNTPGVGAFGGGIIGAIDRSQVLVLVLSENSNSSDMVLREIAHAVENKIPIIVYRIQKAVLSDAMKFYIGLLHHIDVTSQAFESPLEKLMWEINIRKDQNKQAEKIFMAQQASTPKSSKCSVTGRVVTFVNGKVGIGGAYVALVKVDDSKSVCYEMATDPYAGFQFPDIDVSGQSGYYQIYAYKAPYGDGYSDRFTLEAGKDINVEVAVIAEPARMEIRGENGSYDRRDDSYSVDGSDVTIVDAFVYDSLGNPVEDGCHVIFNLMSTSLGGKLESTTAKISNAYMAGAFTKDGVGKVKYVWGPNGRSCKIHARCTEYASVYASLRLKNNR